MINASKISLIAIGIGIASSLILFSLIRPSPYILAIGPVIGIILGKPLTPKSGAFYGVIIGATGTIYLALINAIPGGINKNPMLGLLEVIFIICFWGLYGAGIVWIKQGWERRKPWFF